MSILKSVTFKVKTIVSTFLATFEEIGLLFILPSGHTVDDEETQLLDGSNGYLNNIGEASPRELHHLMLLSSLTDS